MLFGVFGLFCVFVIVLNLYDPLMKPEVRAILEKQPKTDDEQLRSFYYVVGLTAGIKENPEEGGRKLWQEFESLPAGKRGEFYTQKIAVIKDIWPFTRFQCNANHLPCSTQDLKANPDLAKVLDENRSQLDHYMKLNDFGATAVHFTGSDEVPYSQFRQFSLGLHRMMILQWAAWLNKGGSARVLDSVESSNHYIEGLIQTGNLLDRMVGLVMMKENLEFLLMEINANPKLKNQITPELIHSFRTPNADEMMAGAADTELRFFAHVMHSIKSFESFILNDDSGLPKVPYRKLMAMLPARIIFRPNESINAYYDIMEQSLASDCPQINFENEYQCIPALKYTLRDSPIKYVANPMGRAYVQILSMNITRSREKAKIKIEKIYQLRENLGS